MIGGVQLFKHGNYRFYVADDFQSQDTLVWIGQRLSGLNSAILREGEWEEYNDEGPDMELAATEPTFRIKYDILPGLVAALSRSVPVDDQTHKHLEDALDVRDRLLTLIERKA